MNAKVIHINHISGELFSLKLSRENISFKAGQFMQLGINDFSSSREYSIASSETDDFFEFLIKKVPGGYLSNKLSQVKTGDSILISGPFGNFTLDADYASVPHYFIASGTGVSPFQSIISSNKNLNYLFLEGNNYRNDKWKKSSNHILCSDKEASADYKGRVTNYLSELDIQNPVRFYLCGNRNMIADCQEIINQKLSQADIRTEPFY